MQDYPNRAAALAGAGLPPEPAEAVDRRRAGRRPADRSTRTRRWRARSPRSSAPATAAALEQLLREHPALASARLGDPARGQSRTLLHVVTDWPGHVPEAAAKVARAGRRRRRRQRPLHRPAQRDAAALGGQQRRHRGARRAAGRRRRHRGRRRRDRRRHPDGRRRRLRPVEGRAAAARTRRAHQPLAGRRARPGRPRPRRARRDAAARARGPRQRAVVRRARRPARDRRAAPATAAPTRPGSATTTSPPRRPPSAARRTSSPPGCASRPTDRRPSGPGLLAPEDARDGAVSAAVVLAGLAGGVAVERGADAAALAAPRLDAFLDGDGGDQQPDDRVEPPGAGDRVAGQADQQRAGEVGAEHVLAALALGGGRADLLGDALLGDRPAAAS